MKVRMYPVYMRELIVGFILRLQMCGGKTPPAPLYRRVGVIEATSKRRALSVIGNLIEKVAPQGREVRGYRVAMSESCVRVTVDVRKTTWKGARYRLIGYIHADSHRDAVSIMRTAIMGLWR